MDAQFLTKIPIFATLGPNQLEQIASVMESTTHEPGEVIYRQGEPGDRLSLILRGRVEISSHALEGEPFKLAEYSAGEFFGELSLLDGGERTATVTAVTETETLDLLREDFLRILIHHPEIALKTLEVLSSRLRSTSDALGNAMSLVRRNASWRVAEHGSVRPRLPLLEYLVQSLNLDTGPCTGFIGLQHLMGSTASLVVHLTEGRISPQDVFLLGKPYSTNIQVMNYLQNEKSYYVHPKSSEQAVSIPHNDDLYERIDQMFAAWRKRKRENKSSDRGRILLIDDGGHAIRRLHDRDHLDIVDQFTCVEQTRSGIRTMEDLQLRVPVINVAESWVKLEHESPLIAESVKIELFRQLVAIESGGIRIGRNALVIGYGSIGRYVAARLHGCGFLVSVFDQTEVNRNLARQDGFPVRRNLADILPEAELILGCTGTAVLDLPEYDLIRDGAILISTSSSDVEFKAWQLRSRGTALGIPKYWNAPAGDAAPSTQHNHPCFSLYRITLQRGVAYLVNGGFPVNFNGEHDPIPSRLIQLTRGLLFAGALQALGAQHPGLQALDDAVQSLIMRGYAAVTETASS